MPSVTTSVTRVFQRVSPSVTTAHAARITSPPIEWPTSAIRRTPAGQWATRRSSSEASATPFSAIGSPVLARR